MAEIYNINGDCNYDSGEDQIALELMKAVTDLESIYLFTKRNPEVIAHNVFYLTMMHEYLHATIQEIHRWSNTH